MQCHSQIVVLLQFPLHFVALLFVLIGSIYFGSPFDLCLSPFYHSFLSILFLAIDLSLNNNHLLRFNS
jgi:hypothetical protein